MKKNIHPQYHKNTTVTCACGNKFTTGSTQESLRVELCSACHPFYTGKQKLVDTENLVKKFEAKKKAAKKTEVKSKKEKRASRKAKVTSIKGKREITLKDMLKELNKKS